MMAVCAHFGLPALGYIDDMTLFAANPEQLVLGKIFYHLLVRTLGVMMTDDSQSSITVSA